MIIIITYKIEFKLKPMQFAKCEITKSCQKLNLFLELKAMFLVQFKFQASVNIPYPCEISAY